MKYFIIPILLLFVSGCVNEKIESSEPNEMSFFITSKGPGNGADLGGLAGADLFCQKLAESEGSTKTWHAYLSSTGVNARDRIGTGPWYNAKGILIATDLANLHSNNNITKETALTEKGEIVNGRGDTPNRHDILTGSQMDGTAFGMVNDTTCQDWTSSRTEVHLLATMID